MGNRTISVRGTAEVRAPADITIVSAVISGKRDAFDEAMEEMARETTKLKEAVQAAGIPAKDLKTSNLSVRPDYRKEPIGVDMYGNEQYREVMDGFSFSQNIRFEFPNDSEKLSKAIYYILKTEVTPSIDLSFRNHDMEGMKNKALSDASKNARDEAETILGAVGAKLGRLVSVERNARSHFDCCEEAVFETRANRMMKAAPTMIDVEPVDTVISESVVLEWEIADRWRVWNGFVIRSDLFLQSSTSDVRSGEPKIV
ncbi:MAG: SIMPL domain-containing protein [Candidatus Methanomethylophilaceae archaeon]|nr:SIMPL domain-containing protein [Candidatus Methanomethylophilaceae archaeon]